MSPSLVRRCVRDWSPEQVAAAAGVGLAGSPVRRVAGQAPGPLRVTIDSRAVQPGDLFVGLPGAHVDGGQYIHEALAAGAWGVLVAPEHALDARRARPGVVLAADDPLAGLQALARCWRRTLGAQVIGITGSTGKTSTKDMLAAMLAQDRARRVVASEQNLNTEIGLPLQILRAPAGTDTLVLEMAMRGSGQIAELVAIAEPDVGVIVNVGPVHLELLGSLEAIAATKAELLVGLRPGATAVVPFDEPLLDAHVRTDLRIVTFGEGGDVADLGELELPFDSAHMRRNALAALAAARAVGVEPRGRLEVTLSALRGQRTELPGPVVVIDDCYNANPMSMRAALDDLSASASGRRVAVLGDMLELGPDEGRFHEELGAYAAAAGVDVLVAVGPLAARIRERFDGELHAVDDAAAAAALVPALVAAGDTVLVKGSRGVGLEVVAEGLRAAAAE
jgi:UDP-N-acetylmuramoyl-tripeptide--D-alanyl-D-alanine ligase